MENNLIGQAKQFDEKINNTKTQFFSVLDDFKFITIKIPR